MSIPFEPTRSYVYNAARYEILPQIAEIARVYGDEPFLLRDITKQVLAERYTPDQLDIRVKKAKSDKTERIERIFGFYIPFLAENLKVLENIGGGFFRNRWKKRWRKPTPWRQTLPRATTGLSMPTPFR